MAIQREYLSPNEIAEYLGVSPFTIRRYIKLGELRAVKLLGGFRVHRDDLQRFLKAHEVNPAEEEWTEEEAHDASPAPETTPAPAEPPAPERPPARPPAPAVRPVPAKRPAASRKKPKERKKS